MAVKDWNAQYNRFKELSGWWGTIAFTYSGRYCGLEFENDPNGDYRWILFSDEREKVYENGDIDDVWSEAFFDGKSMADLKEESVIPECL